MRCLLDGLRGTEEVVGRHREGRAQQGGDPVQPVRGPDAAGEGRAKRPGRVAGFMLAPVIGPPIMASRPTTPPTTQGRPLRSATSSRKKVRTVSSRKACSTLPAGTVTPRSPFIPNSASSRNAARLAPTSCAATYGSIRCRGKFPARVSAKVAAGLMCAPLMGARAAITTVTVSPKTIATPACPSAWVWASTTAAPGPKKIRAKVPISSATRARRSGTG